jgi:hypothetical protein
MLGYLCIVHRDMDEIGGINSATNVRTWCTRGQVKLPNKKVNRTDLK